MATQGVDLKRLNAQGDELFRRADKINAELFSLTYGALVVQLIKDYEDYGEVNKQLDKMGYNIGTRLIEDFLARSTLPRCSDFREVGESTARVAFKTFLGVSPSISHNPQTSSGLREFSLYFDENPLAEFVELPDEATGRASQAGSLGLPGGAGSTPSGAPVAGSGPGRPTSSVAGAGPGKDGSPGGLWYSQVLCGVVRGALEMIGMSVEARFVTDVLRGDETTEMRVRLIKYLDEEVPQGDD